ncbi:MAG: AbrB family transcriptional regulator [Clostridia bacterium]|nr:AbrB family transcriptional regulator [Clostridia bacterium]
MNVLLTLAVSMAAGYLLYRLKVPGGMLIGAMVGACALRLITDMAYMPPEAKTLSQILAGALIGASVSREQVSRMKGLIKPAAILMFSLLAVNIICGYLIYKTGTMDLLTALMSSTPGGISNIPMIAADMGADPAKVLVMQLVRFFMGIALFPTLIRLLEGGGDAPSPRSEKKDSRKIACKPVIITLTVAMICGILGYISPLPSGTMAFATLGAIALKYIWEPAHTPKPVGKLAQCLSGAYVGAGVGWSQLHELTALPGPVGILLASYMAGAALISFALYKSGCFTRKEAMLAATPAGASDIALISADLGISNANLVLLQVLRLVVVISVFPPILGFVAEWLA